MQIGAVSSYGVGFSGYSSKKNGQSKQNNGLTVNAIMSNMGNTSSGKAVSPAKSLLQSLYEQKKALTESKNELVEDTLSQNKTLKSIESQLKSYEKQLKSIDDKIKEALSQENLKGIKDKENTFKKDDVQNSSKEDQDMYNTMQAVMSYTSSKAHFAVVNSAKNKMEGELKVIASEIKQDGGATKSKDVRANSIKARLENLTETLESAKPTKAKKQEQVETSVKEMVAKQDVLQSKINTYNQNVNPPIEQYQRALFNIMV